MDKKGWEELTKDVFNEIFRKSAVKRTKYEGTKEECRSLLIRCKSPHEEAFMSIYLGKCFTKNISVFIVERLVAPLFKRVFSFSFSTSRAKQF
jgi:hypothetical protein